MKIIWSPLALERMGEIAEYIAQDNITAAEKWIDQVFDIVERLKAFPESGRIVNNQTIREIIYSNYRIIYRKEEQQISILTVRHGKQLLPENEILP